MGLRDLDDKNSIPKLRVGEVRNGKTSFVIPLDDGELLTGTPTVAEVTTSDLTISNVAVSTAALTINGETVAIGMAVTYKIIDQVVANSPYTLLITAASDASPAQTFKKRVSFEVEA